MTEVRARPQESMFRAASRLRRVLEKDPGAPGWRTALRAALSECVVAVEHHLGSLVDADGVEEEIVRREPRLLPALERLSVAMSQLLIHLWETRESAGQPGPLLMRRLDRLVDEINDVAAEEFMLVIESFHPAGALD